MGATHISIIIKIKSLINFKFLIEVTQNNSLPKQMSLR